MDDRRLQRLVKMAVEAERLEHPAAGGVAGEVLTATDGSEHLSLARRDRVWWRAAWIGGGLAAAACLTVVFVMVRLPGPVPTRIAKGHAAGPEVQPVPGEGSGSARGEDRTASVPRGDVTESEEGTVELASSRSESDEAVLFAVYRGANGSCECVQVNDPDWGSEKRLADVSRHELLRAGLQDSCMSMAPEVLVIGVEGKRGTLPSSRQHAETIARRLGEQSLRGRDVSSLAYAAMPDLPTGTVVVAEKVSIGP
jgi:hypothetical protein